MKINQCKIRKAISCDREENVVEIAKKLRDGKERHIVVVENEKPVGIISTTDMNNRVIAEEKNLNKTKAEDIMTESIVVRDINDSLGETYTQMIKAGVFSCVITEKGKLKGILDLREATNHLVKSSLNKAKEA